MPYDGTVVCAVVDEICDTLINFRVDTIYQIGCYDVVMHMRNAGQSRRLLISANPSSCRLHMSNLRYEHPSEPPMFCMLLRKHLAGGRLVLAEQHEFDRIIRLGFECSDELGDLVNKFLIVELLGKHSNIILLNSDNRILNAIKHVDFTMSQTRQILPKLLYHFPATQNKTSPMHFSKFESLLKEWHKQEGQVSDEKFVLDNVMGISPQLARRIKLDGIVDFFKTMSKRYSPTIIFDNDNKPLDFFCFDCVNDEKYFNIDQKNMKNNSMNFESISNCLDEYYRLKGTFGVIEQRSGQLVNLIKKNIKRCNKKIKIYQGNIDQVGEKNKMYGDLITANIYRMEYGMEEIEVVNYYNMDELIVIPLNCRISPAQNAQAYYTLYNKSKIREEHSKKQLTTTLLEKEYLENVLESIHIASTVADIDEIKLELTQENYIRQNSKKKKHNKISEPLKFISSDGHTILIGKNNKQNDNLTFKIADPRDIWLHVKAYPGSHVIIQKNNGNHNISQTAILEAANMAMNYSKARSSPTAQIDYTNVKNVKKIPGAKPGMVVYKNYRTIVVNAIKDS